MIYQGIWQDCIGIASSLGLGYLGDMATSDTEVEMEEVQYGTQLDNCLYELCFSNETITA